MSEFHVRVFRIGKVGKHPSADTLSITQGPGGYPVCFKTGEFASGDLAVHIPVDAVVDTARPEFSWLADKASLAGDGRFLCRVKSVKLRNIPSYGFLVPLQQHGDVARLKSDVRTGQCAGQVQAGQDVRELLGVTKYDPGPCYELSGLIQGDMTSLPQDGMVPHYDIEGMRRYSHCIQPGELVSVTEKVHGSNGRWVFLGGVLLCGSRTKFRTNSVWNKLAERYGLELLLGRVENQGLVLYGEVYGTGIQDLTYGKAEPEVLFFDMYDSRTGLWWNTDQFQAFCDTHGLPRVPELYRGPYDAQAIAEMAEGTSTLPGANHVREGIVVKPLVERWDQEIGRVFLKQPGEDYLLRKGPGPEEETRIREHATFVLSPTYEQLNPPTFWDRLAYRLANACGV